MSIIASKSKKSLCILIALLSLSAASVISLGGCGSEVKPDTSFTDEEKTGMTAPAIDFASDEHLIVRPEYGDDFEIDGGQTIMKAVREICGVKQSLTTDFVKKGDSPDTVPGEILVGMTNRKLSAELYDKLNAGECAIAVMDGKLIVLGYTPELTSVAADILVKAYLTADGMKLEEGFMAKYEIPTSYTYKTFNNPVAPSGADPWVVLDEATGEYYYCYSGGNGVCVNRLESLAEITTDGGKKVYTAPEGTMYSREYWAPELHKINGRWYIYVAADDGDNFNHRMYVLGCKGDDPTGEYELLGKLTDPTDKWAIDGTVLQYKGELYFIWSGWEGDENVAQNIYIAHMSDPYTIDSERAMLSRPEYRWERRGGMPSINEGPVAVVSGDTVHIIYSASGSWSDYYCLGKLTYGGTGDILDPSSWKKADEPQFSPTETIFGPGHCSFTTAPDGATWMIYHANTVSGSGWGGRKVWAKPIEWNGDDIILGTPVNNGEELQLPIANLDTDNAKKIN